MQIFFVGLINYIPIATTLFSLYFFVILFKHWYRNKSQYIFWWMFGVLSYGAGTITESINTLAGYHPENFKAWYIFGALLGGVPLAQGTVYLLLKRKTADVLSVIVCIIIIVTSALVLLSPLKPVLEPHAHLNGKILEWQFIRGITPVINIYAFVFLVGGAIYSAILYMKAAKNKSRFWGNVCIAIGGLLPGIGGSFTKFGHVEVLYVTEFIGICFIYLGYRIIKGSRTASAHSNQLSLT